MKICVSKECKNKCEKHITNNEIDKGKTYCEDDFCKRCDNESKEDRK